jgi:hypothetical protein
MKKEVISNCKLCDKVTKLCHSHIIPEFFYKSIYNEDNTFKSLRIGDNKKSERTEQKGLREYLFCKNCEGLFHERYTANVLYNKGKSGITLKKTGVSKNVSYSQYEGFDYKSFKLFLSSIIWRISISSKFNTVPIPKEIEIKLKTSLKNQIPLEENELSCLLNIIHLDNKQQFDKIIIGPYETDYLDKKVLNILIDGYLFGFILGDIPLSNGMMKYVLNKKGEMTIGNLCINNNPTLLIEVKKVYDNFKNLY